MKEEFFKTLVNTIDEYGGVDEIKGCIIGMTFDDIKTEGLQRSIVSVGGGSANILDTLVTIVSNICEDSELSVEDFCDVLKEAIKVKAEGTIISKDTKA